MLKLSYPVVHAPRAPIPLSYLPVLSVTVLMAPPMCGLMKALRGGTGRAVALPVEDDPIGTMTQPVQGGGTEQTSREGLAPLGEIQVAGHDDGGPLIAFRDVVVEVLVLGWAQGLEAKGIDDEQRCLGQGLEAALEGGGGARRMQGGEERALGGEEDIVARAHGAMPEGLGDMTFPGAAGAGDQDRHFPLDEAPGGQVADLGLVDERGSGLATRQCRPGSSVGQ